MIRSEFFKLLWQDPIFRKKQCEAYRKAWTPRRRELARKRQLGHQHSEATINKISESNIKTWHDRRRNG